MPRTVIRNARTVVLFEQSEQIFKAYENALASMELSQEKESPVLSSVQASTEMPVEDGFIGKAKRLLEQAFHTRLGGSGQDLPKCSAKMDSGGHALFRAYYQDFWIPHMTEDEGISAEEMEKKEIKHPYVLIMEFYLRLVIQALRVDSELRTDQERRIFIKILLNFGTELSKQNLLSNTLRLNLFKDHKEWLDALIKTADQIDQLNKAKPILRENLEYLGLLEDNIIRYLIVCLAGESAKQDIWKGKLSENHLPQTLRECQNAILAVANKSSKSKEIVRLDTIEPSVVIQKVTSELSNEMSKGDFVEHNLVEYGLLSRKDAQQQKEVIEAFKDSSLGLRVKYLYGLFNKTRIIYQFVSQIDNLVESTGWLPLLFRVVELAEVDKIINSHILLCNRVFNSCKNDKNFFGTPLGQVLGECTHAQLDTPNSLPNLGQLQEAAFLQAVFAQMKLDFSRLTTFGALVGCQVKLNPFLRKATKTFVETNQALSIKPDTQKKPKADTSIIPKPPAKPRSGSLFGFKKPPVSEQPKSSSPPPAPPFIGRRILKSTSEPVTPNKGLSRTNSPVLSRMPVLLIDEEQRFQSLGDYSPLGDPHPIPLPTYPTFDWPDEQPEVKAKVFLKNQKKRYSRSISKVETVSNQNTFSDKYESVPKEVRFSSSQPEASIEKSLDFAKENVPEVSSNISSPQDKNKEPESSIVIPTSQPLPSNVREVHRDQRVAIEMPLMVEALPQQAGKNERVKEKADKTLYPAQISYIKEFVDEYKLTAEEIANATKIFDTDERYFEHNFEDSFKRSGFSSFRCEVIKLVKGFFSRHVKFLAPQYPLFDCTDVWRQRSEEITVLQYLCIGPKDDSRLILFIERMKKLTIRPFLWPASKYNELIENLEKLLDLYYTRKLKVIVESDINKALLAETETLRRKNYEVSEKNIQLEQDLKAAKTKVVSLEKENHELRAQYRGTIKGLNDKVEKLGEQVEQQQKQHKEDMEAIKKQFAPFFKPTENQDAAQHSPFFVPPRNRDCTIV